MPNHEMSYFILRTLDAPAATAFYDAVLGHHADIVFPLHENARARGARPHWLGLIDTPEPEARAAELLADGGERLGPLPNGGFVVRDGGGALLGLGPVTAPSAAGVVWHVLRTREPDRAGARYARSFGWALGEPMEGGFRAFSWRAGAPPAGVIGGLEDGVHPQWLHFFGVASFDEAVAAARTLGATLLPTGALPDGRRYAVGDDPQGAAFGLMER